MIFFSFFLSVGGKVCVIIFDWYLCHDAAYVLPFSSIRGLNTKEGDLCLSSCEGSSIDAEVSEKSYSENEDTDEECV